MTWLLLALAITFPSSDGGTVEADDYGQGKTAVVLVHGGRFNKDSWAKQIPPLTAAGFRVLSINLRGYGKSTAPGNAKVDVFAAPLYLDVVAAAKYLHGTGAKNVYAVGGSLGGGAASIAMFKAPKEITRLVMLGTAPDSPPELLQGRKLIIHGRQDANGDGLRLPRIQAAYDKMAGPKEMILLETDAHAQYLFDTPHADRVMREILKFLSAK
jgi:predicted alpha/beta hydrolase